MSRWLLLPSLYSVHYQGLRYGSDTLGVSWKEEIGTEWVGCLSIFVWPFWSYSSRPLRVRLVGQSSSPQVKCAKGPGMIPGSKSETPWKIHYFPFLTKKNNFFDESQVPASGGTGGRSSRASPNILERHYKSMVLPWMLHWDAANMKKEHWFMKSVERLAKSLMRQFLPLLWGSSASWVSLKRFV